MGVALIQNEVELGFDCEKHKPLFPTKWLPKYLARRKVSLY
ncbi:MULTISPECIES: hypothetical protein [Bacillus]|uniref:Uncharacterized protein n=1 Tax=Bacillus capparidis TaxID=1840411 RepID=A0ABS4CT04_9BACI|nr:MULTISPECIES: hypothetical protein [Bacillus]MBP1080656.1 hypothetical protein [Bacillus capparidis]MED1094512.1 hypothetical protein [Bacillus capparidis]